MLLQEDLTPFVAEFGDAGTLDGQPVRGIYEADGEQVFGPSGFSMTRPAFQLPSSQVPSVVFHKALIIPQGNFKVERADPDGTGFTVLWLSKT